MGYHTYNLAEFRVSSVGRHQTYILFFSEHYKAPTFAEAIGNDAVAISNSVNSVDWMFRHELPDWMANRFASYETVLICSRTKESLDSVLSAYKKLASWRGERISELDTPPRPDISVTSIPDIALIILPVFNRHSDAVDAVAGMVKNGIVGQALREGRLKDLCDRIQETTDIDTHLHRNVILVDLVRGDWRSKSRYDVSQELFAELSALKGMIADLPQSKETNALLRELADLRKEITNAVQKGAPLSVQASVGFEAFGNGVKLLFDSQQLSTSPLDSARGLFARLLGKVKTQEKLLPNKSMDTDR